MVNNLGNKKIMAKNLKKYMQIKGINRQELSAAINVPYTTVSDWCNGKTYPRIDKIELMANYFRINKTDLIEEASLSAPSNRGSIPVLGSIPAGTPLDAVQDIRGYIDVPISWVDDHGALIVSGDSMAPKYLDGDTVIFRIQPDCESGQDCVAYVNGYDATLKKVIKNGASIVLQPINPEYAPIVGNAENPITILGVVVELRRRV